MVMDQQRLEDAASLLDKTLTKSNKKALEITRNLAGMVSAQFFLQLNYRNLSSDYI